MQIPAGHQQGPAAPVGSFRFQAGAPDREAPATMMRPGAPAVATTQQPPAATVMPDAPPAATAQQSARPVQQRTPAGSPEPATALQASPPMPAQQVPMHGAGRRQGSAGRGVADRQQAPRARPVFSQSAHGIRQPSARVRGPSILPARCSMQQWGSSLGMTGWPVVFRSSPVADLLC